MSLVLVLSFVCVEGDFCSVFGMVLGNWRSGYGEEWVVVGYVLVGIVMGSEVFMWWSY